MGVLNTNVNQLRCVHYLVDLSKLCKKEGKVRCLNKIFWTISSIFNQK